MNEKKLPLNSLHLKLLAVVTMLIDHMGFTLFPYVLWMRCVGRLAFPIFCFLIAEGCVYTHDRRKYALRLLAFALLSEIPFNLMNSGAVWDRYHQNVLWTLLTGALVCWLIDWALKNRRALAFVLTALVMAAAFYLLERLNTDYGGWGMLLVVMFYGVHRAPGGAVSKMIAQLFGLTFFSLAAMGGYVSIELWSLVALVPIWLYRGRQGYHSKPFQYACYAFYPVHMLLLVLVLNFVNR